MTSRSRIVRSLVLPAAVLMASGLTLTACGGSADSTGSSSAAPVPTSQDPSDPNPFPAGDCSQDALNSAASNATSGAFGGVEEFACDGGYAVVMGKMNDQYLPLLFKAEDGTWRPVEIQEVCQSGDVPAKVAELACA